MLAEFDLVDERKEFLLLFHQYVDFNYRFRKVETPLLRLITEAKIVAEHGSIAECEKWALTVIILMDNRAQVLVGLLGLVKGMIALSNSEHNIKILDKVKSVYEITLTRSAEGARQIDSFN